MCLQHDEGQPIGTSELKLNLYVNRCESVCPFLMYTGKHKIDFWIKIQCLFSRLLFSTVLYCLLWKVCTWREQKLEAMRLELEIAKERQQAMAATIAAENEKQQQKLKEKKMKAILQRFIHHIFIFWGNCKCKRQFPVVVISGVFRSSKRGAKCLLATSAHTKGGKPSFPIFLVCQKKIFGQRGPWPIWPRGKYATGCYNNNNNNYY